MSNGFPTGEFTVTASDSVLFPVDGITAIVEEKGEYQLTTPSEIVVSMTLEVSGCLFGTHSGRSLLVCQIGISPVRIAGIVTILAEANGGGQWTAEGGGDTDL